MIQESTNSHLLTKNYPTSVATLIIYWEIMHIKLWLLTPYRDYGNLSVDKIHYNKVFSGTRVLIENTFGLLKNRFRNLMKLEFQEEDKITKFIMSCCVLHNLCIDYDDIFPNTNTMMKILVITPNLNI